MTDFVTQVLTDVEWALIEPLLPPGSKLGRPRETDLRSVVNAILYMGSTGCQWGQLPKEFPPYSTVQGDFYAWSHDGVFASVNHAWSWRRPKRPDTRRARRDANRLGFAAHLAYQRFPGRVLGIDETPRTDVRSFIAGQLSIERGIFNECARREETHWEHLGANCSLVNVRSF